MEPNSTNPIAAPLAPYPSRNIRLSSALWAMQFVPRVESEPATLVVDFETKQPVVTFWHEHTLPPEAPVAITFAKMNKMLTATHVGLWWKEPAKYSVEGYDDALSAMRRVHEAREWLIGVIKGKFRVAGDGRRQANSVTTESLHIASVILACDCELVAFDRRTFVFSKKAAPIAALIHQASNSSLNSSSSSESSSALSPEEQRRRLSGSGRALDSQGVDPCIDWMYAALVCRDRLMGFVKQCIAMIEKRDGDRVLRLSSQMPKTLRREFTRRF